MPASYTMDPTLQVPPTVAPSPRNLSVVAGVLVLHVAALWALQNGLLRRAVEVVVPIELLGAIVTPPAPRADVPPPPQPAVAPPPVQRKPPPATPPAPRPVARPDPVPAPQAPLGVTEAQPAPPPVTAPVAVAAAPVAVPAPAPAPAPAPVQLPSSDADYLQNPKPAYPAISRRLGEQGKVVVRVLIGVDGTAQAAELRQSSGYDRLDQAALGVVRKWRYVPGKRGGVPEPMWFNVPITFVLD